ncbi:MAG: hypothetical protein ACR2HQ_03715 [Ilumatobacteraceae bacterium]
MTTGVDTSTEPTAEPAVSTSDPVLPTPGVYLYDTVGDERVDAIGGSVHDHPATTTITLSIDGDCVATRWDALDQRWDQAQYCRTASGWERTAMTAFHSFFHQDGTVVGIESVQVDGRSVDSLHVHDEVAISGNSTGQQVIDRWYSRDAPLLLTKGVRTGSATLETAIGAVHYDERFELALTSLQPIS